MQGFTQDVRSFVETYASLGSKLREELEAYDHSSGRLPEVFSQASRLNPWFTADDLRHAFSVWANRLNESDITGWLTKYEIITDKKTIGVINAGNIPLSGLHDLLSVLASGHRYQGKNASDDRILLPFVASLISEINPMLADRIAFTERLSAFDAVIATGSNNSARYFEAYFSKVPHIIRKNRNAVAVLSGSENESELNALGNDIFRYFGLGCRSVSKLYVPSGYDFSTFFIAIESFGNNLMSHAKYMNNFDYNSSILLLKKIPFLQNHFLIVLESEQLSSPVSILHVEYYDDINALSGKLTGLDEQIQCVVNGQLLKGAEQIRNRSVSFGNTQDPGLTDYADGADTMAFLTSIA